MTMNNGLITVPKSLGPQAWATPGAQVFFSGAYHALPGFTVTDVSGDATNEYIRTTWQGGWPPSSWGYQGVYLGVNDHPAPKFTCTNCTDASGNAIFADHPPGAPIYTYSKRTYTGANSGADVNSQPVWGHIVSFKINVTKPYTGAQSTLSMPVLGVFGGFVVNPDKTFSRAYPTVNLKIAGERIITANGVTGAQPGDDFTASWGDQVWKTWDVWFPQGIYPYIPDIRSENSSVWPSVTIEIQTDQGFGTSPTVTPTPTPTPPPPPPPTCTENWSCGNWGSCSTTGTQTRTCTDLNSCGTTNFKPSLTQSCTPPIQPSTFAIGTRVKTTANLNVRAKASNGKGIKILCTQPAGSMGTIKGGPASSGGYTWWNINYDTSCDGWSVQNYLAASLALENQDQVAAVGGTIESLTTLVEQLKALLTQLQTR
jgi:hypothetical protein